MKKLLIGWIAVLTLIMALASFAGAKDESGDGRWAEFVTLAAKRPETARKVSKLGLHAAYKEWLVQQKGSRNDQVRLHRRDGRQDDSPGVKDHGKWFEFIALSKHRAELARRVSKIGVIAAYREWLAHQ